MYEVDVIATSLKDNGAIAFTSGICLPGFHHRTYPRCHRSGCSPFGCMIFLYFFECFLYILQDIFLNVFGIFWYAGEPDALYSLGIKPF